MTVIKGQATIKYRIVCPNFREAGHTTHVQDSPATATQDSPSLARAKLRAESNNRLYEKLYEGTDDSKMSSYYRSEIGWQVQTQTVTEWENVA